MTRGSLLKQSSDDVLDIMQAEVVERVVCNVKADKSHEQPCCPWP